MPSIIIPIPSPHSWSEENETTFMTLSQNLQLEEISQDNLRKMLIYSQSVIHLGSKKHCTMFSLSYRATSGS